MGEFTVLESPSNERLAVAAQAGCRASFAELVSRFQVPLLHFLRQRTDCWQDAEDLTQDVFVRAFRSLRRYQPEWRFSTWLYTIAHRLSLNARRRWRPVGDNRALDGLSAGGPAPDDSLALAEDAARLWAAAAQVLTSEQLTSLWLFYVEELPLEEIARVLGRSPGAAKGLLFRGRRKLAESLPHALDETMAPDTAPAAALDTVAGAWPAGAGGVSGGPPAMSMAGPRKPAARRRDVRIFDARRAEGCAPVLPTEEAAAAATDSALFKILPPRLATELYDG